MTMPAYVRPPEETDVALQSGQIFVRRTYLPSGETDGESETIVVRAFETAHATVSAKAKSIINRGNYESLAIEAFVSLPCYVEEVEAALERAAEIAGNFIASEEHDIRVMLGQIEPAPEAAPSPSEKQADAKPAVDDDEDDWDAPEPTQTKAPEVKKSEPKTVAVSDADDDDVEWS